MSIIGGPVQQITLNSAPFAVAADEGCELDPGIDDNKVEPMGDRSSRLEKVFVPWSITGCVVGVDIKRGDLDLIQQLANSNGFFPCSITLVSGDVMDGKGQFVGGVKFDTKTSMAKFDLKGSGVLSPQ